MDRRRDRDRPATIEHLGAPGHGRERVPWRSVPPTVRAFVRLHRARLAYGLLLLLGLTMQLILIAVVEQLVDLSISLMEVWAELARKQLELTLFFSTGELTALLLFQAHP